MHPEITGFFVKEILWVLSLLVLHSFLVIRDGKNCSDHTWEELWFQKRKSNVMFFCSLMNSDNKIR